MNILFVQYPEDVSDAIDRDDGNTALVAMNASAMWALEKRNIPYRIGPDFYPLDELHDYRENLYDRVEMICARLDEILVDQVPVLSDSRDEPLHLARVVFRPVKCLLNAVTQNLTNILRPLEALGPRKVCVYTPPPEQPQTSLNLDADRFNMFYKLLKTVAKARSVCLQVIETPRQQDIWRKRVCRVRLILNRMFDRSASKLRDALRKTPAAGPVSEPAWNEMSSSPIRVFTPKPRYSIGMLAQMLTRQGAGKIIGPPSISGISEELQCFQSQFDNAWRVIRNDPRITELFTFEGIGVLDLVGEIVRTFLETGLVEALRAYRQTRRKLGQESADVMLVSTVGHPEDFGMVLACQAENVPVVTWQHGSYAMFEPHTQPEYYDIRDVDHFFVFGEGTKRAFSAAGQKWNTQIVPVGSAPLDKMSDEAASSRSAPSGRPTVLVPLRGLNISVIGDSYQSYPLDLYWRELQQMLAAFAKFPQLQFVLKLYPANTPLDNPIGDFLKTHRIKNVCIKYLRGFTTLLPEADLVVLDWPYSTLLEAISTPVPVICYRKHWPLRDGVEEVMRKRCFLADCPEELDDLLQQYANGRLPILNDRTLLREYGTNEDDGESLTRGLRALRRIGVETKTD